ncbi:MAG TPA: NUDIX hydrolase [Pyrinomonadaceae bacterium]|jgi:8-oxo-dGTP pyrophosphatase MutT (NUDIX family)
MNDKLEIWRRVESKRIADCRVFNVREDFCERASDNLKGTFFVLENPDWVNVIALTENEEVVLIEQYRHGAEAVTLEIPGGMVDAGEPPEAAARRELAEETGYTSENFVYLGKSSPNPALQNNRIFHFLALNCRKTVETDFDEHESIAVKVVDLTAIDELICDESITHSLVLAGFYRFEQYRKLQQTN